MPIGDDTLAWRRDLPHLEKRDRTYFITFRAMLNLEPEDRAIALRCCLHGHTATYWLDCAVVMPDHVHIVVSPYDSINLPLLMRGIKGTSARWINARRTRVGAVWQREYFDRILRSSENQRQKSEYVVLNPVRAALVSAPDEYRWLWRSWVEGEGRQEEKS